MGNVISFVVNGMKEINQNLLSGQKIVRYLLGKKIIVVFDNEYLNSGITDIKKVDFVGWQIRD